MENMQFFIAIQPLKQYCLQRNSDGSSSSRSQTFFEMIHDIGTNLLYNVGSWPITSTPNLEKEEEIIIQGKVFSENNKKSYNYQQAVEYFQKIIWITYRRNFPSLIKKQLQDSLPNANYVSDTGWGCMVRVGQMAFAEALRRHLTQTAKKKLNTPSELRSIILAFLDEDKDLPAFAPYSIQKISKMALKEFQLLPGEWYTPIRICYILGMLHNEQQCLPGTENLKVGVFTSSQPVIFEDFLERMCKVDKYRNKHNHLCGPECRKIQSISESPNKFLNQDDVLVVCDEKPKQRLVCPIHHELEFSMVACIVCMIGKDSPQEEYLRVAIKIMDFKYSLGILGGKPKKAFYFVGRVGSDFIYLDPHYVQESSNHSNIMNSEQLQTYFCSKFQTFPSANIDSSFSFMFYLKDLVQLEEFYQFMMGLKRDYSEHFFIMMEDTDPYSASGQEHFSSNLISQINIQNKSVVKPQKQKEEKEMASYLTEDAEDGNDSDDFEVI